MKTYRIQVRYKSNYYDAEVKADDDFGALVEFFKQGFEGQIKPKDEGFCDPNCCFVTLEEVNDVTKVNIGETTVGVAVGQQSVSSG
jgi:hypothetical protein